MPTILLHQWEMSPFCNKVRRALRHKGLAFETRNYNGLQARLAGKLSAAGTLPVLDYDGERVVDSSAIAALLDRKHPERPLYPTVPEALALVRFWEDWAGQSLYFAEIHLRMLDPQAMEKALDLICEGRPRWERTLLRMVLRRRYSKKLKAQGIGKMSREQVEQRVLLQVEGLEAILAKRPFLVGESMSIADLSVAAQLDEIARTSRIGSKIAAFSSVAAWMVRTDSR